MKVLAPAKINLFLSVGPRRDDGLHVIESVMQSVSLYDTLSLSSASSFALDVAPPGSAPEDESNLVVQAVRSLWATLGRAPGASVALSKEIPAAAGLGGGSSDAAAALVGLNQLWDCGISRKALAKIGASIGADVPFCVGGGTAAVRGAGESLSPLPVRAALWWAIVVPSGSLSTADVYSKFDSLVSSPAVEDPFELADALARGEVSKIASSLRNDLEPAAESLMPSLASVRSSLMDAGAVAAVMSGSGPAWCALARDEEHARSIASSLSGRVYVASSLSHGPKIVKK